MGRTHSIGAEDRRLAEARDKLLDWRKWGPYLSERQWGTVREDYSRDGNAWEYFSHDQARSRAYRWGEDGIAGISDNRQRLCFAIALWNGKDPILKERMFGLTNNEGNHGEDVKEYYFYLDSTPTHSYMKYLYKYPQAAYPYAQIINANREARRDGLEYELVDTGVFDDQRYFDVFVEYAKASPEDLLIQITAWNRGPDPAMLQVLPTLWFRNTWFGRTGEARPVLCRAQAGDATLVSADHAEMGRRFFLCESGTPLLFTENETNTERIFGAPNRTPYVKDGINNYIVHGQRDAVNPAETGTKVSVHHVGVVAPGASWTVRLRLTDVAPTVGDVQRGLTTDFEAAMELRRREADEFYSDVIPASLDADRALVMRQALAGMLWTKQFYYYDLDKWLEEHGADPFNPTSRAPRNVGWHHMYNADIISMPDKWEYPWYAAWDLAFHVVALTMVDEEFGKRQLDLMLQGQYLHPNGQLPAYEWNFGDVNPPVHAWSTIFTYRLDQIQCGKGDLEWLERSFQKLLLNFTWWVNRKDRSGSNVFEGGFLGLDNIGVFDRSAPLPTGGYLDQADGTAWMALFCQNMVEIAVELSKHRPAYVEMARKFVEHFVFIASSMSHAGGRTGMWDEEDGFYYDVLRLPDGTAQRLKVRSMVGLLPLCSATVYEGSLLETDEEVAAQLSRFLTARPELCNFIHDPIKIGKNGRRLASVMNETMLRRVLTRMLDEDEFLSPYGIRSLSRHHKDHPFVFTVRGQEYRVSYLPAESDNGMFGGNSNWRGPIWMPVNTLILRALLQYYMYFGDDFTIECPTGSGKQMTLYQVANEINRRLVSIFVPDEHGRRPAFGGTRLFQEDPYWRDCLLFHEYFHGDNGAGIGANHQTGWTGLIARGIHLFSTTTAEQMLTLGKAAAVIEVETSGSVPATRGSRRRS
jgi:hypothetical protein